ncbi:MULTISPECIES: helix-turn-helix domain-containing protein [Flavobacterium]|uniref:Helix-turn-helix domain-containing protein n=1 Tax=Flavobacterium jumunjinense TaxID=998845 RepID=A0ABV5GJV1_9FLAO|nr:MULTISPECIES: helix-turn-helix domain-containing protein [Flavobacterium]
MINVLHSLFAGSTFLLAFLIITNTQKINIKANKWFASFIICIFFIAFETLLDDCNMSENSLLLSIISVLSCFSISPLFYLSIVYFTNPDTKWRKRNYLHFFLPLSIALLVIFLFAIDDNKEPNDVESIIANGIQFTLVTSLITQLLLYPILSYIKLLKHKKNIRFFSSNTEKIDLKWLQYLCVCLLIMIFFWMVEIILDTSNYTLSPAVDAVYLSGIFFITYNWSKQKEVYPFNSIENINDLIVEINTPTEKKKKLIEDDVLNDFKSRLLIIMNRKKPFLDCELNLEKLAQEINTSTHILSYVINTGFNENFYQFINRYRIEEAKKLIQNNNHLSLLGIGFEVGFNSKTTFNTTFKKITNKTPSEFKKMSSDL